MLWVLIRIASRLMSTHNICFYGEIVKIIPELSSNTLICPIAHYSVIKPLCSNFRIFTAIFRTFMVL